MPKFDNTLLVGAPFVQLRTTDPPPPGTSTPLVATITPTLDPSDDLITLQEGNLISFSEKKITGKGNTSDAPTIFIKFLDPEMVILPRFFDKTILKLYKSYFNQLEVGRDTKWLPGSDEWKKFRDEDWERIKEDHEAAFVPGSLGKGVFGGFQTGGTYDIEYEPLKESERSLYQADADTGALDLSTNPMIEALSNFKPSLHLKYGNGTGAQAPWRKIILTSLYITQDSSDNMVVNITAAEDELDIDFGGMMSKVETDKYFPNKKGLVRPEDLVANNLRVPYAYGTGNKANVPAEILQIGGKFDPSKPLFGSFTSSEAPLYNSEAYLVSLLENLYQKFLIKLGPKDVSPFVFLSPKIPNIFRLKIDSILEKERGLKAASADESKWARVRIAKSILAFCGISMEAESGFVVLGTDEYGNTIYDNTEKIVTYYLTMRSTKSTTHINAAGTPVVTKHSPVYYEDLVSRSISNLYRVLDITEGGYPNDHSVSKPLIITNPEHVNLFVHQLCKNVDGDTRGNLFNNYTQLSNSLGFSAKEVEVEGLILNKDPTSLARVTIKVYTDYVIGQGLLAPFSPSYSTGMLDIYIRELNFHFKGFGESQGHSNAYKFINNKEQNILDYIIGVADIYEINSTEKVDFDLGGNEEGALKELESLPVFVANTQDSNVFDVVMTEKEIAFSNLLQQFNFIKVGAINKISDILTTSATTIDFSDEEFDRTIGEMLNKAYKNNTPLHTVLLGLGKLSATSTIDTKARAFFELLKEETKAAIQNSNQVANWDISYAGMTAHLNYIQSLSNNVAMVSIKTVPYFNLVSPIILGKPCLFLNNTSFFALTRGMAPKGFLSGIYLISGYEHTISDGDCYSNFIIQRQPFATDILSSINKKAKAGD